MKIEDPQLKALLMGGEYAQKAADLNEQRGKQRLRASYEYVLNDARGRAFIGNILNQGHFYFPCNTQAEEGARRVCLMIRNTAAALGFMDAFNKAEQEQADFENEIRGRLEQAEKKEREE